MEKGRFVSYLRVSTDRQGRSGLGLEAQRKAVEDYLNGGRWEVIAELVEVESGSRDARPKLVEALTLCRGHQMRSDLLHLDGGRAGRAAPWRRRGSGISSSAASRPANGTMAASSTGVVPVNRTPAPMISRPQTRLHQ